MFGLFRKGPLLDAELTQWQFDCFEWLLQHTGGIQAFRQRRLILPTPQFFPHDGSRGHAFAEMIFNQVKAHAGMADWVCTLGNKGSGNKGSGSIISVTRPATEFGNLFHRASMLSAMVMSRLLSERSVDTLRGLTRSDV